MTTIRTALVVDDDHDMIILLRAILEKAGYRVLSEVVSLKAMERIETEMPDCVLLDIMMPGIDGLQLCQQIRSRKEFEAIKVIMVSAKPYDFDRQRAIQFGADAYFIKPIDPRQFLEGLEQVFQDAMQLRFWGVRGTLPIPGEKTLRYGGNTNCITLQLTKGPFFIFDAGSGIRNLSDHLMAAKKFPISAKILISHPHWDHINGLPFFVPLYIKGNEFEVCCGFQNGVSTRKMISDQMDGVYFPIKIKEFSARVYFRDLQEETWDVGHGATVSTMLLNHPGTCLGYRINYGDRKIAYITDQELYPPGSPYHNPSYEKKLIQFVEQADILIMDATYSNEEYRLKSGWGHSTAQQAADLAHRALVKTLCLHHHDPDQMDDQVDLKLEQARQYLINLGSATQCIAPAEGDVLTV
ncbi:MAG: response regulator [Magnetococcales bacterium]|nr:response regulator [Magnetococcales bacterium]MBF0439572.1 response regulator [Magnetococcales bacterium]